VRSSKPSVTARHVALTRATFDRPVTPTGDADAEIRLYRSLGSSPFPRRTAETTRMQRRTAFFDSETLRALDHAVAQMVIVAAGYDGRALRFSSPGVRWFEVDHPATQNDKRSRLSDLGIDPRGITFVPVDLTKDDLEDALGRAGHDRSRPSLFLVEGLLGYLSREVSTGLLATTRKLACEGSRMAVAFPTRPRDASTKERVALRIRATAVSMVGEPWLVRFGPDEPDRMLETAGWRVAASDNVGGGLVRFEGRQGVLLAAEPA